MGMYTTLAFHIKVKPEYRQVVSDMLDTFDWSNPLELEEIKSYDNYPFTKEYCSKHRATFIPYGAFLIDINAEYSDKSPINYNKNDYNEETGDWEVGCSLKNYDDEIEFYEEKILPILAEECYYIYDQYEEYDSHRVLTIEDGKLKLLKENEW